MKNSLGKVSRLLLVIAAVGLIVVLATPIWRIELSAPQYPEGLNLTIHANGLKGNVDIINGLNHYIGMKSLHNDDFIEFKILPYCIVFFAIAFVGVAVKNQRKWLNIIFVLFVGFGVIAMVDFWKWEYNYGHNLNPNAAIVVPGMAYQPPLIGFKQLLNFGAYSIPDVGGWIFIGAGVLLLACVVIEWRKARAVKKKPVQAKSWAMTYLLIFLGGCAAGPEPIVPGKDNCSLCKMGISDSRYGGEVVTGKGKVYKFDDLHCLISFLKADSSMSAQANEVYVVDFAGTHSLIKANQGFFLQSSEIRGPMDGNTIAFQSRDSLKITASKLKATDITWNELIR